MAEGFTILFEQGFSHLGPRERKRERDRQRGDNEKEREKQHPKLRYRPQQRFKPVPMTLITGVKISLAANILEFLQCKNSYDLLFLNDDNKSYDNPKLP